jgi:ParB-like chromosome segregation protein Spo0J
MKAASLIKKVRFVIVDGHHCFNALKELQKEKFPGLPKLV